MKITTKLCVWFRKLIYYWEETTGIANRPKVKAEKAQYWPEFATPYESREWSQLEPSEKLHGLRRAFL